MTPDQRNAAPLPRDNRIDFLRGLALLVIFTDHIYGNWVGKFTLQRSGFADAAAVFVYLSGLSFGIAYLGFMATRGWAAGQLRATYRALQIYAVDLFTLMLVLALQISWQEVLSPELLRHDNFDTFFADPFGSLVAASYFYYTPQHFTILPTYVVLVLAAPAFIFLFKRRPLLAIGASAALYLAVQVDPSLSLPQLGREEDWAFNPFAWQFLFVLGILAAAAFYRGNLVLPRGRGLLLACWSVIVLCFAFRIALFAEQRGLLFDEPVLQAIYDSARKDQLHPLYLGHFLALAYVTAVYLRADAPLLERRWAWPVIAAGRHSLEVFAAGVVLSTLATIYLQARAPGLVEQALANAGGWIALCLFGLFLERVRRRNAAPAAASRPAAAARVERGLASRTA